MGTLPVPGAGGELLGVLDLQDVLALVRPAFVKLVSDFDFVHDFGPIELAQMDPATRARPVSEVMPEPHAVEEDSGLLRAYAFMRQHGLENVAVTDRSGKLVGIASQVDIGVGFLRTWLERSGGPMTAVGVSSAIFLIVLAAILLERGDRTIVAIGGAAVMVTAGLLLGFYDEQQALQATDFSTLGLLLGMMILVSLLKPTGLFEVLAVWAARASRGHPAMLVVLLGLVAAFLSMILYNVTTVVLLAPLTILIAGVLGISAVPLRMVEAILSNVGGVATLIGDPPNILFASASGLSLNAFLSHSLPAVLVIIPLVIGLVLAVIRRRLATTRDSTQALRGFRPDEAWTDRRTAQRVVIVLAGSLLLFLLQDALRLTPAFIALSMAAVALVWTQPSVDEFLKRID